MVGGEWCRCFEKADRPCLAMKRRGGAAPLLGAYRPSCDADGFFRATQCHAAVGTCWCVDKHGVEVDGSRARGKPDCEGILNKNGLTARTSPSSDDSDRDDDSDEIDEGSGDY